MTKRPALLLLRDGTQFTGIAYGSAKNAVGEVVFNTSMTGYQEILTDPSYAHQCVTFTYPHIGNTGINDEDNESDRVHAAGAIIRSPSILASNYRSQQSLSEWMEQKNLSAIAGIDTRALTHHIRNHGAQDGAIVSYQEGEHAQALVTARNCIDAFSGLYGTDLAIEVTTKECYQWNETDWQRQHGYRQINSTDKHVVVYDFGVKRNILRLLAKRHCRVSVVPATTPADTVLAMNPDGVLLSNGPGDPQPCGYAIEAIRQLLEIKLPVFGICLGFQLLALALGGTTKKMKFGHHGANHPVEDIAMKRVYITSQNHGFEVDSDSLAGKVEITHRSLFDGSLQGFQAIEYPAMGFQGHPEASPGPKDIEVLFDDFIRTMNSAKA